MKPYAQVTALPGIAESAVIANSEGVAELAGVVGFAAVAETDDIAAYAFIIRFADSATRTVAGVAD